ncbi:CotH kinase family protein [Amycolatopsis thermoflava]|uniref:CotH kinase family protein n=1 Tax=Amycolatopsis thermoflava TaxID=84480 RepID=UPI001AE0D1F3|nr:CotH kinase family protein [Amycolatopsis thermoflava]
MVVLAGVFGSGMIRPYTTSKAEDAPVQVTEDIAGTKDLFDTTTAHDVRIEFNDANYQKMLQEYFDTGEKDYIPATVVIDGTRIENVGIRLKGNSTLASLTWNGERRQSGGFGGGQGGEPPAGMQLPEGAPQQGGPPQGGMAGGMGGIGTELKAEEPESLPWLISFDKYVEGRRYQGHTQIAVRPGSGEGSAQLNESLAMSLVDASGEPAQQFAYSGFTVNDRTSTPRLLVEYLDEGYAEDLGNGVLYKSLASSQFTYQGGDQTEYSDDFKQINNIGGTDVQPVIELIRWVEQSSDEEFAAGLADRVDVESFARYLALQNIVLNGDDMAGPGRNYYLWYDLGTRKFTVIGWDMNLTFTGDATAGPHDSISMGFGGGRGQPNAGGAGNEPPQGMQLPEGMQAGGGLMGGNKLKERFLASDEFKQVYEEQYRQVYSLVFADGKAESALSALVSSYNLNTNASKNVQSEAATLQGTLEKRATALAADSVISGG